MNDFYNEMKSIVSSEEYYSTTNFNDLLETPVNMFKYGNLPEEMEEYFELFESWESINGMVAIGKLNNELIFARGGLGGGKINNYGFMTHFIGTTANGISIDWEIGKDCVVIYNNKLKTPDIDLIKTAELLKEIDISIDCNVDFSRLYPVPMVSDQTEKTQVETIFDNMRKGTKKATVINRKIGISDLMESNADPIPTLNLTDVSTSDKIQYLAHFRDDVKRWFYTKYGHCVQSTGKMAQQTEKEIDGNTSVSFIYPLDKLDCRKKGIEKVNKMFGLNITVEFSESWAIEYEKFKNTADPEEITEKGENENDFTENENIGDN